MPFSSISVYFRLSKLSDEFPLFQLVINLLYNLLNFPLLFQLALIKLNLLGNSSWVLLYCSIFNIQLIEINK